MASRIESPTALIPAGTAQASPVSLPLTFREMVIDRVDIVIPPGPSGLVGFFVAQSGNQIIPFNPGQFIIADDKYFSWPLEDYPTGAKWTCVGYNTDIYPHTIQFHFLGHETTIAAPLFPGQIPLGG